MEVSSRSNLSDLPDRWTSDEENQMSQSVKQSSDISYGDIMGEQDGPRFSPEASADLPVDDLEDRYNEMWIESISDNHGQNSFPMLVQLERDIILSEYPMMGECTNMVQLPIPDGSNKLRRALETEVHNPMLYSWIFCATMRAYTNKNNFTDPNLWAIRATITNLEAISRGGFGTVWKSEIATLENLAYIKTIIPGTERVQSLIHEFFIGNYLNKLRSKIPNFMYTYGLFNCSQIKRGIPCPDPISGKAATQDYLIIERINPGYDVFSALRSDNLEFAGFMSAYLQVIASIGVAYQELNYTHYDLHTSNVLIQDIPSVHGFVYIPYTLEGKTIYIKATRIAKIIDYGKSHITITRNGKKFDFGYIPQDGTYGVRAFKSNPLHDIYKFTGKMLRQIRDTEFMVSVHKILTRFTPFNKVHNPKLKGKVTVGHFIVMLEQAERTHFEYDWGADNNLITNTTFMDQINHVLESYPQLRGDVVLESPPVNPAQILTCSDSHPCTFAGPE